MSNKYIINPKSEMLRLYIACCNELLNIEECYDPIPIKDITKSRLSSITEKYKLSCTNGIKELDYLLESISDNDDFLLFFNRIKEVAELNKKSFETYSELLNDFETLFISIIEMGTCSIEEKEEKFIELFDKLPASKYIANSSIDYYFCDACELIETKKEFDEFNKIIDLCVFNEKDLDYGKMSNALLNISNKFCK